MTEDYEKLVKILGELNLPRGEWMLSGSGILVLYGLRDHKSMGDVDIFVTTRLWCEMFEVSIVDRVVRNWTPMWELVTTDPDDDRRRCDPPFLRREMHGLDVDVFFSWRLREPKGALESGYIDINERFREIEFKDGIPHMGLRFMLDWKKAVGRPKDMEDIVALERYFNGLFDVEEEADNSGTA